MSAVTIGEIQAGIENTRERDEGKAAEIEAWLECVAETHNVLSMDAQTFRVWARLMHRRSDSLIEDAMIATTAAVHNLTVVTAMCGISRISGFARSIPSSGEVASGENATLGVRPGCRERRRVSDAAPLRDGRARGGGRRSKHGATAGCASCGPFLDVRAIGSDRTFRTSCHEAGVAARRIQPRARKSCHSSGMPFRVCIPKSSNLMPEPATRSFTVRETSTSSAPPMCATRDAM